jgi:ABC-type Zn uptake system ZnuABC Zn-binding protein ZnuA
VRRAPALLLSALVALAACSSGSATNTDGGTVSVVTTTTQLTDFARVIGGARVTVYGVLKANVDPHDYEPSPADLQRLADADVIVKNGVGLEKWFDDTIAAASPKGAVVDASNGVPVKGDDPHIWHDPTNASIMAANIAAALETADPSHADEYRQNLATYQRALAQLDADTKAEIAGLANKKLVTNHDAFRYFIDHYGLELVGTIIPSFDTAAELSAADIDDIVGKIEATGVKAVFSESSIPPKTAEAIAAEAGVKVVAGEDALYGDSLGPEGSDGDTYLKMEAHNARVIVANLS